MTKFCLVFTADYTTGKISGNDATKVYEIQYAMSNHPGHNRHAKHTFLDFLRKKRKNILKQDENIQFVDIPTFLELKHLQRCVIPRESSPAFKITNSKNTDHKAGAHLPDDKSEHTSEERVYTKQADGSLGNQNTISTKQEEYKKNQMMELFW